MGLVYAVANQKGGVGKTTTSVNLTACVARNGAQTLLADLDPQCNATVALGGERDMHPSSYDCLVGEVSVAEAARPAGPDNLWLVPANADLAGAAVELPRMEGSETRLRERLGPVRERFAFTMLDCPPSLGPSASTRWWPPIESSCRFRPSIWPWRGWSSSSRRSGRSAVS